MENFSRFCEPQGRTEALSDLVGAGSSHALAQTSAAPLFEQFRRLGRLLPPTLLGRLQVSNKSAPG
jgi:hypothetical protein